MSLAQRIKYYRRKRGFSQEKVSNALGIRVTNYAKYESGERNPRDDRLIKLANILRVSYNALFIGAEAEFMNLLYRKIVNAVNGDLDSFMSLHIDVSTQDGVYNVISELFKRWEVTLQKKYKTLYEEYLAEPTLPSLIELNKRYKKAYQDKHCHKFKGNELDDETLYKVAFCIAADKYMDLLHGDDFCPEFYFSEIRKYKNDKEMDDEEALQLFAVYILTPFLGHLISTLEEIVCSSDVGMDDFANAFIVHGVTKANDEDWLDID